MRFLCDVHISFKVVRLLQSEGFNAVHLNDILDKSHTKDGVICKYADDNDLIVLTKDVDFKNSFLIGGTPQKLVKVSLGNLATQVLIKIINANLKAIERLNARGSFMIELDHDSTTFIER
jgi:predicted nuclease of predicted toxin-antitoxin system